MARPLRLIVPGQPHHLIQRGHNRQPVFLDDLDRQHFLADLQTVCREHGLALHAYVLMSNHIHLLLTPASADGLSRAMQSLGRRYVAWFNHRHQRSGALWEGRFRTCVIETEAYFLACQRYIELNPQRAGLASDLLAYPWSSLSHHLGARSDPLVSDHPVFWQLGNTPFEREAAYRRWLEETLAEEPERQLRHRLAQGGVLGSERFLAELARSTQRPLLPRPRGRPPGSVKK